MTLIEHDGKRYLAISVSATAFDGSDGFDVCVIEVTPAIVSGWLEKVALADRLRQENDVQYIAFVDYTPEWRVADFEADPVDVDGDGEVHPPIWNLELPRTEGDVLEVGQVSLEWIAMPKHAEEHVSAFLWRNDLPALVEALGMEWPRELAQL